MVIDTHALLWWLISRENLSPTARDFIDACESGGSRCLLAGVSLWELELTRRSGRLDVAGPIRAWVPWLKQLDFLELIGASCELWLAAAELDWGHRDPADRLIAVTAIQHGVPVLTKDRRFHSSDSPVNAVW